MKTAPEENLQQQETARRHSLAALAGLDKMAEGIGAAMGQREKYWSELSIEEKIERCREQTKMARMFAEQTQMELQRARQEIRVLRKKLNAHAHEGMPAGQVMLPAKLGENELQPEMPYGYGLEKDRCNVPANEVYF